MRCETLLVVAVLMTVPLAAAVQTPELRAEEPPPVPRTIDSAGNPYPPWIAAQMFVTENGEFDLEMVESVSTAGIGYPRDILDQAKRTNASCVEVGTIEPELPAGFEAPNHLDDLVANAFAVIHGTVVGSEGGFFFGMPGMLLQIRVDQRLKPSEEFWTDSYIYAYYPVGEFSLGPIRVCKTQRGWPRPPASGSEVLLFPQRSPLDDAGRMVATLPMPLEIVMEHGNRLSGPSWLAEDERFIGTDTLEALIAQVRARLAANRGGQNR